MPETEATKNITNETYSVPNTSSSSSDQNPLFACILFYTSA